MLSEKEVEQINNKLLEINWTRKELANHIGMSKSYTRVIMILNRKSEGKSIEWKLRRFINEEIIIK